MPAYRTLRLALAATAITALPFVTPALADNNGNGNPNAWYQGGWGQNTGGNGGDWRQNGWSDGRQAREQETERRQSKFGRNRDGMGEGGGGRDGGRDGGDD